MRRFRRECLAISGRQAEGLDKSFAGAGRGVPLRLEITPGRGQVGTLNGLLGVIAFRNGDRRHRTAPGF